VVLRFPQNLFPAVSPAATMIMGIMKEILQAGTIAHSLAPGNYIP